MKKTEFIKYLSSFEYILKRECQKYRISGMNSNDIAQEVRIRLYEKCILFKKGKASFNTWATKVMKNCIKNLLRDADRQKREPLNDYIELDDIWVDDLWIDVLTSPDDYGLCSECMALVDDLIGNPHKEIKRPKKGRDKGYIEFYEETKQIIINHCLKRSSEKI